MPDSTCRKPTQAELNVLTVDLIGRVYSGKPGCMCGCNGKYYEQGPMVKKVLNRLRNDPNLMVQDNYILYIDHKLRPTRNYVIYLKDGYTLSAQAALNEGWPSVEELTKEGHPGPDKVA